MKVRTHSNLVAETEAEAKLLAEMHSRIYGDNFHKPVVLMWELCLPSPTVNNNDREWSGRECGC